MAKKIIFANAEMMGNDVIEVRQRPLRIIHHLGCEALGDANLHFATPATLCVAQSAQYSMPDPCAMHTTDKGLSVGNRGEQLARKPL